MEDEYEDYDIIDDEVSDEEISKYLDILPARETFLILASFSKYLTFSISVSTLLLSMPLLFNSSPNLL